MSPTPKKVWSSDRPASWADKVRDGAENLMTFLSPSWALERQRLRVQSGELENLQINGYRNARYTRVSGRTRPTEGRADFWLEVGYDRRELVDRARQLERDSVIAEALLSRATENVVGNGYKLRAQSTNPAWNDQVEEMWHEWVMNEADIRGLSTLHDLMALSYRSWLRDGDVGVIKHMSGALQFVESDQIANPLGNIPTKKHIDGVELDENGKPVAFLVVTDPDPQWASVRFGQEFTRVPAQDMLYLARRQRHGQTRGLSAFSSISWLLDQIDGHLEAVTVAARMAACVGLIIERQNRQSGLTQVVDSHGNVRRQLTLEPGMIGEIGQGDKIHQIDPKNPAQSFPDYLATLGRLVGLSFGLPLEIAFLDFSRTNYSSARASLLQAHKVWEIHQGMMARFQSEIYRWWLYRQMTTGKVRARRDAFKHDWIMPGWKWVDPEKELNADLAAVDAGIMSLADLAEKQGKDLSKLLDARAAEIKLKEQLGIPDVRSRMTRDAVDPLELAAAGRPPEPSGDSEKKDESSKDEGE